MFLCMSFVLFKSPAKNIQAAIHMAKVGKRLRMFLPAIFFVSQLRTGRSVLAKRTETREIFTLSGTHGQLGPNIIFLVCKYII